MGCNAGRGANADDKFYAEHSDGNDDCQRKAEHRFRGDQRGRPMADQRRSRLAVAIREQLGRGSRLVGSDQYAGGRWERLSGDDTHGGRSPVLSSAALIQRKLVERKKTKYAPQEKDDLQVAKRSARWQLGNTRARPARDATRPGAYLRL